MNNVLAKNSEHSWLTQLFGEWRIAKYFGWMLALACIFIAFFTNDGIVATLSSGIFQTGLLFGVIGYLSELRYSLIPSSRND